MQNHPQHSPMDQRQFQYHPMGARKPTNRTVHFLKQHWLKVWKKAYLINNYDNNSIIHYFLKTEKWTTFVWSESKTQTLVGNAHLPFFIIFFQSYCYQSFFTVFNGIVHKVKYHVTNFIFIHTNKCFQFLNRIPN